MNRRIIVVGGGISGLAAAHRLMELDRDKTLGLEVLLLEAGSYLGGSITTEHVGDFLVENGPDAFVTEKPWALQLCERLGITSRLISTNPAHQKLYVVHKGSLQALPEGFFLLAPTRLRPLIRTPLFSWHGKLRMALDLILPRGGVEGDESLASFVRRRFGREALERVAQPLIGGVYAADPEKLSLAATMPRFPEMERAKRSVIWAMWSGRRRRSRTPDSGSGARWSLFVTFMGGMQELIDAIACRLPGGAVHLGADVTGLEWDAVRKSWMITTGEPERLEAKGVILATPSYRSADILSPFAPDLAGQLRTISYSSTATVSLAYRRDDIPHSLDGFGIVAPAIESRKIIACSFSSIKYTRRAPEGHVLLRAFVGGALQPALFEQDDSTLETSVRQELASLLGIKASPLFCRIHRHPRSMPQYNVGHLRLVWRLEEDLKQFSGLELAGSAYHGVGIPDCVRSGEAAAEKIWSHLKRRANGTPVDSDAARKVSG
ncbi:MAG: protoporphyrinogen oxidase [Candidatus Binatia bacterium]